MALLFRAILRGVHVTIPKKLKIKKITHTFLQGATTTENVTLKSIIILSHISRHISCKICHIFLLFPTQKNVNFYLPIFFGQVQTFRSH
jgi:hypothetical protein